MTEKLLEETIRLIAAKKLPAPEASGFYSDIDTYFTNSSLLENTVVEYLGKQECLYKLSGTLQEKNASVSNIYDAMFHIYKDIIYYNFHASSLNLYRTFVSLRFITVPVSGNTFVTGQMNLNSYNYSSLVENLEQKRKGDFVVEELPLFTK